VEVSRSELVLCGSAQPAAAAASGTTSPASQPQSSGLRLVLSNSRYLIIIRKPSLSSCLGPRVVSLLGFHTYYISHFSLIYTVLYIVWFLCRGNSVSMWYKTFRATDHDGLVSAAEVCLWTCEQVLHLN
jgi:hypothetical protein